MTSILQGQISTNRVEGSHANLKRSLEASNSLFVSYTTIDKWYRQKDTKNDRQLDKETFSVDSHISTQHKNALSEIVHNVSAIAMNAIKIELSHLEPLKHTAPVAACTMCSIYVHFNIPCRHMIP
ncbi:hypothetical protein CU097_010675 [Rhizopus azygosporus]|uniref:SWIM-type domain-containing protein n=1 Tax=Rhizopus azygosporus TaxID=86630 RepID=A0A367JSJ4_RHIAZ|nr:hypothetical protein CU097_010675 [Rhizopus azygosporus]